MDIAEHLFRGYIQALLHRFRDPLIGLMGHDQIDVILGIARGGQGFHDGFRETGNGMFKYIAAVHIGINAAVVDHLMADPFIAPAAGVLAIKLPGIFPVGVQVAGQDAPALFLRGRQHCRSRAIAKDNRHVTPLGTHIQRRALHLAAHHQDGFIHTAFYKLIGNGKSVHKAGALGAYIQRADAVQPQFITQQATAAGKGIFRAEGGKNNKIHIGGGHCGLFQGRARRGNAHGGRGFPARFHPAALLYPRPFPYPGVRGLHHRFQVMIGYNTFRDIFTHPGYSCIWHRDSFQAVFCRFRACSRIWRINLIRGLTLSSPCQNAPSRKRPSALNI